MSRALLIGGFGSTQEMLHPVGEALGKHFEDVEVMSLREAEGNADGVRHAADGAELFTHSGGIGPTMEARPLELHGFAPAVRSWASGLMLKTLAKQRQMHQVDHEAAVDFERESTSEILGHPFFHVRELFRIASMDAIGISAFHQAHDIRANLAFFDADAYFELSEKDRDRAELAEINIVHLAGQHDELILNPEQTLYRYLSSIS